MAANPKCGIYVIEHMPSGRVYVGQASDIYRRWAVHEYCLKRGIHHCTYLQRIWDKYEGRNFAFKIIETCSTSQLNDKEIAWFDYYKKLGILLNIHPPGKNARGYKHKEITKGLISKAQKEIGRDLEERKRRSERAKQQHKNGNLGRKKLDPTLLKRGKCKTCDNLFIKTRTPTGQLRQTKYCTTCKPTQRGGYYKYFNP